MAIGEKPDGSPFKIGVQKPFAEQNDILTSLDIRNQSVVSSGTYERYFEKDGKIYHHILNPFTGYPYETHLQQVTIISDASVDGDALSTLFVTWSGRGIKTDQITGRNRSYFRDR